jgi:chloramphenicol 3-O phosphotransferase
MRPTILFLNGPSSSGKTTVGRCFQNSTSDLWLLLSIDAFFDMFPSEMGDAWPPLTRVNSIYHETAALWVRSGYNVIIDTVIDDPDLIPNLIEVLSEFRVYTIGLRCPLEELTRREKLRGNRSSGLAERQFNKVHAFFKYDLELETSSTTPEKCANKISQMLLELPEPAGFVAMKTKTTRSR